MTDLLERYLQAIGQYLPPEQRADVVAELRANLLETLDSRAEEKGAPLTDADLAAVLRQHGKPEAVALRYLPQRSLIGPTIYPFYRLTVLRVIPLIALASLITQIVSFATGHMSPVQALSHFATGLAMSAMISLGIITAIFAMIERAREQGKLGRSFYEWDPMKLPKLNFPVPAQSTVRSTAKKVLDLGLHCLWFAYVLWIPWHPFWLVGPGVVYLDKINVGLAPIWHTFYVLLIGLLTVQLILKIVAFLPGGQKWKTAAELATRVVGWTALGLLCTTSTYFVPLTAGADLTLVAQVNHSVSLALRIAFVLALVGICKELWKALQGRKMIRQMAF
jgi:hypothetical protein